MYKAVIFDFGNVLCGVERGNFVRKAARHARAMDAEALLNALWGTELEYEFETGKFDSHEYFRRVQALADLDPAYSYEQFVEDYKSIIVPNPDGERGLETAAGLGVRMFVLSNTSFLHASVIFDNEVLGTYPELYMLSYKLGVMKPDLRIWKRLLEYTRLEPADCLYVDDIEEYCEAARSLGMSAFCYDFRVHDLSQELKNMLQ
jgi:haloacid dehalogenase superfamily, subfamily IA, variant 3 with third motif having DD or ED